MLVQKHFTPPTRHKKTEDKDKSIEGQIGEKVLERDRMIGQKQKAHLNIFKFVNAFIFNLLRNSRIFSMRDLL